VFMLVGISICAAAAADLPHVGRWRLNPARSDFGGLTLAFESTAAGAVRGSVNGGPCNTFSFDGRDVPTHSGYTSSWRQLDARTWSSTTKLNGAIISTDRFQLSGDDRRLSYTSTGTQPDGKSLTTRLTYVRTSGATGLIGTWKAAAMPQGEQEVEFLRWGEHGLTLRATNATCEAQLDGKDYRLTGPTMPAGATLSLTQTGPRSILLLQKQSGRLVSQNTLTVSPDGRTLTETVRGTDAARTRATKVYERQ
jgi:hypothetical protein